MLDTMIKLPRDDEKCKHQLRTVSYSTSLLDVKKSRVKDCSMIYPSGLVRTILMPDPCYLKLCSRSRSILLVISLLGGLWCEIGNEVSQDLAFNCYPWLVPESIGPQL